MKKYVVAIASLFTNENHCHIVEAIGEKEAIIEAMVAFNMKDSENNDVETATRSSLSGYDTVDDMLQDLFGQDLLVSNPIQI